MLIKEGMEKRKRIDMYGEKEDDRRFGEEGDKDVWRKGG